MASKRQTILDYLVTTLLPGITTGAGYNFTVGLVQRGQRDPEDITDDQYPCLFIGATDESRENITVNQFTAELEVTLIGGVKSPDGVSGAQENLDKFIADVTKAVMTDHKQGGLVYSTNVKRIRTDHGDLDLRALFVMQIVFKYATEGTIP